MAGWYYFNTAETEHSREYHRLAGKRRQAKAESKRRDLNFAAQQKSLRIQKMIDDLQKAARTLDHDIADELDSSWVKDTSHFAFPMSARVLIIRRDNLRATIAGLSDQLAVQEM